MTRLLVVDFDDTMVRTECRIRVVKQNGIRLVLSSTAFAAYAHDAADVCDFSEFETVRRPKPILPTIRAMRRAVALGMAVVVCTARGNPAPVQAFLRRFGLEQVAVIALNSGDPQHKRQVVESLMHGMSRVSFLDDASKNVVAVGALVGQYADVKVRVKQV